MRPQRLYILLPLHTPPHYHGQTRVSTHNISLPMPEVFLVLNRGQCGLLMLRYNASLLPSTLKAVVIVHGQLDNYHSHHKLHSSHNYHSNNHSNHSSNRNNNRSTKRSTKYSTNLSNNRNNRHDRKETAAASVSRTTPPPIASESQHLSN